MYATCVQWLKRLQEAIRLLRESRITENVTLLDVGAGKQTQVIQKSNYSPFFCCNVKYPDKINLWIERVALTHSSRGRKSIMVGKAWQRKIGTGSWLVTFHPHTGNREKTGSGARL